MTSLQEVFETRKYLNKNVFLENKSLDAIKQWIKDEHLPNFWDDSRLLSYLRCCNFSLETTKKKLGMYLMLSAKTPEFFTNQDVGLPEFQKVLQKANVIVLPSLTPEGNRVTIAYYHESNFDSCDFINLMRLGFMLVDTYLELEEAVPGNILILDASVFHLGNLFKVSLQTFRKFLIFVQEALPFKLTQIHFIRPTFGLDFVMKMILPFCKEKVRRRFHLHKNLSSLYDCVPQNMLPQELGGSALEMRDYMDLWVNILEERKEWFQEKEAVLYKQ